jgi:hypothetical protein
VHPPSQLFLKFLELGAHAVWPGLPLELEMALPELAADEREAQKKLKVSGLPTPRCRRVTAAKRQGFFTSYLNAEAQNLNRQSTKPLPTPSAMPHSTEQIGQSRG